MFLCSLIPFKFKFPAFPQSLFLTCSLFLITLSCSVIPPRLNMLFYYYFIGFYYSVCHLLIFKAYFCRIILSKDQGLKQSLWQFIPCVAIRFGSWFTCRIFYLLTLVMLYWCLYLSFHQNPSLCGRSECRVSQVKCIYRCLLMIATKCLTQCKGTKTQPSAGVHQTTMPPPELIVDCCLSFKAVFWQSCTRL